MCRKSRPPDLAQDIWFIPLTQGKYAKVNKIDYDHLMQGIWHFHRRYGHAARSNAAAKQDPDCTSTLMHQVVGQRKGLVGSLKFDNEDKLDCRRCNLDAILCADQIEEAERAAKRKSLRHAPITCYDEFLPPNTRLIKLTKGRLALVDAGDYKWAAKSDWYSYNRYAAQGCGEDRTTLHIEVAKCHDIFVQGKQIDHRNNCHCDDRPGNLRPATAAENVHHMPRRSDNQSGYPGVKHLI